MVLMTAVCLLVTAPAVSRVRCLGHSLIIERLRIFGIIVVAVDGRWAVVLGEEFLDLLVIICADTELARCSLVMESQYRKDVIINKKMRIRRTLFL